jgi:hypothetical protein
MGLILKFRKSIYAGGVPRMALAMAVPRIAATVLPNELNVLAAVTAPKLPSQPPAAIIDKRIVGIKNHFDILEVYRIIQFSFIKKISSYSFNQVQLYIGKKVRKSTHF